MYNNNLLELFENAELFVFDLDGTLVDSKKDISIGIGHALSSLGLPLKNEDEIADLLFQGSREVISEILGEYNHQFNDVFRIFTHHYNDHCLDHTKYYPGVAELLQKLSHKKVAVLSNKRERFCKKIIEGLDPQHKFLHIIGGDTFHTKKPDPLGLKHLCEKLDVPPSKTWMIGDSPVDVQAGVLTGTHTLGILDGFTSRTVMEKTAATWRISHLHELNQIIKGTHD